MKYTFFSHVDEVFHHQPVVRSKRSAEGDITHITEDHGWFVRMHGSYEALYVGNEKPAMEKGDRIKLTVEKII